MFNFFQNLNRQFGGEWVVNVVVKQCHVLAKGILDLWKQFGRRQEGAVGEEVAQNPERKVENRGEEAGRHLFERGSRHIWGHVEQREQKVIVTQHGVTAITLKKRIKNIGLLYMGNENVNNIQELCLNKRLICEHK